MKHKYMAMMILAMLLVSALLFGCSKKIVEEDNTGDETPQEETINEEQGETLVTGEAESLMDETEEVNIGDMI